MTNLYDHTLCELGRVTVSFTMLDEAANCLLTALVGKRSERWKRDHPMGWKLDVLKDIGRKLPDGQLASKIEAWVGTTRQVTYDRNDAIKSVMFYGYAPLYPGIVAMKSGKGTLVTPEELGELSVRMQDCTKAGFSLCVKVAQEIGAADPTEEEESADS